VSSPPAKRGKGRGKEEGKVGKGRNRWKGVRKGSRLTCKG